MSALDTLPVDYWHCIFEYLDAENIKCLAKLSKATRAIVSNNKCWRGIFQRMFPRSKRIPCVANFKLELLDRRRKLRSRARCVVILRYVANIVDTMSFDDFADAANMLESLWGYVRNHQLETGDVVHLECCGDYMNDGKLLWSNRRPPPDDESLTGKFIGLSSHPQECGCIPPELKVLDSALAFGIRHWEGSITGSVIRFDASPYIDSLMDKLLWDHPYTELDSTDGVTYFTHPTGVKIHIGVWKDVNVTDDEVRDALLEGTFTYEPQSGSPLNTGRYTTMYIDVYKR